MRGSEISILKIRFQHFRDPQFFFNVRYILLYNFFLYAKSEAKTKSSNAFKAIMFSSSLHATSFYFKCFSAPLSKQAHILFVCMHLISFFRINYVINTFVLALFSSTSKKYSLRHQPSVLQKKNWVWVKDICNCNWLWVVVFSTEVTSGAWDKSDVLSCIRGSSWKAWATINCKDTLHVDLRYQFCSDNTSLLITLNCQEIELAKVFLISLLMKLLINVRFFVSRR